MSKAPRSFKNFRICDKCNDLKPPRAHHCSVCQKCVMRMDHHCPWTGNCIGLKNHKYFICFCFWTIVACTHVAISSFLMNSNCTLWPKIENIRFSNSFSPLNTQLVPLLSMSVSFGVTVLLIMHLLFLRNNETTIESVSLGPNNPFRKLNKDENISQILGSDKRFWFIPTAPNRDDSNYLNGLQYP